MIRPARVARPRVLPPLEPDPLARLLADVERGDLVLATIPERDPAGVEVDSRLRWVLRALEVTGASDPVVRKIAASAGWLAVTWAGVDAFATRAGVNERTVRRTIDALGHAHLVVELARARRRGVFKGRALALVVPRTADVEAEAWERARHATSQRFLEHVDGLRLARKRGRTLGELTAIVPALEPLEAAVRRVMSGGMSAGMSGGMSAGMSAGVVDMPQAQAPAGPTVLRADGRDIRAYPEDPEETGETEETAEAREREHDAERERLGAADAAAVDDDEAHDDDDDDGEARAPAIGRRLSARDREALVREHAPDGGPCVDAACAWARRAPHRFPDRWLVALAIRARESDAEQGRPNDGGIEDPTRFIESIAVRWLRSADESAVEVAHILDGAALELTADERAHVDRDLAEDRARAARRAATLAELRAQADHAEQVGRHAEATHLRRQVDAVRTGARALELVPGHPAAPASAPASRDVEPEEHRAVLAEADGPAPGTTLRIAPPASSASPARALEPASLVAGPRSALEPVPASTSTPSGVVALEPAPAAWPLSSPWSSPSSSSPAERLDGPPPVLVPRRTVHVDALAVGAILRERGPVPTSPTPAPGAATTPGPRARRAPLTPAEVEQRRAAQQVALRALAGQARPEDAAPLLALADAGHPAAERLRELAVEADTVHALLVAEAGHPDGERLRALACDRIEDGRRRFAVRLEAWWAERRAQTEAEGHPAPLDVGAQAG